MRSAGGGGAAAVALGTAASGVAEAAEGEVAAEGQAAAAELGGRIDAVYSELIRMKKDGWPILNSTPYLRSSATYLKTGRFPADGCDAGRLYFSVSPNGQFTICHRTSHNYVHILDDDFEQYFNSLEYEMSRKIEAGGGLSDARWQERLDRDRVGLRELVQSAPRA